MDAKSNNILRVFSKLENDSAIVDELIRSTFKCPLRVIAYSSVFAGLIYDTILRVEHITLVGILFIK